MARNPILNSLIEFAIRINDYVPVPSGGKADVAGASCSIPSALRGGVQRSGFKMERWGRDFTAAARWRSDYSEFRPTCCKNRARVNSLLTDY